MRDGGDEVVLERTPPGGVTAKVAEAVLSARWGICRFDGYRSDLRNATAGLKRAECRVTTSLCLVPVLTVEKNE